MGGICKNQQANDLIRQIQADEKGPLDEERTAIASKLKEMVARAEAEQKPLRDRQKELNAFITPIDSRLVDIHEIGCMSNQALVAEMLEKLQ